MNLKRIFAAMMALCLLISLVPATGVKATQSQTVRIEAEDATYNRYYVSTDAAFSGGGKLEKANGTYYTFDEISSGYFVKNNWVYVVYYVDAPEAGTYRISVTAKVNNSAYAALLVNPVHGEPAQVYQVPYSQEAVTTTTYLTSEAVDVQLVKGRNVIYMTPRTGDQGSGWVDADCIDITGAQAVTAIAPQQVTLPANVGYYAKAGVAAADRLEDTVFAPINDRGIHAENVTWSDLKDIAHTAITVEAPADGYYRMTYNVNGPAEHGNGTFALAMFVDDNEAPEVKRFTWNSGEVDVSTYLTKGIHTLTITTVMPKDQAAADANDVRWNHMKGLTITGGLKLATYQESVQHNGNVLEAERDAYVWRYPDSDDNEKNLMVGGAQPGATKQTYDELAGGAALNKNQPMLTYYVEVEAAGTYTVNVSSRGYTNADCYHIISVDDQTYYKATINGADPTRNNRWYTTTQVELTAGRHFIRVITLPADSGAGWCNVDYAAFSGPGGVRAIKDRLHLQSAEAPYYQGFIATTTNHAGDGDQWSNALASYQGGSWASQNGITTENFEFTDLPHLGWFSYTVNVPTDGYYDLQTYLRPNTTTYGTGKILLVIDKTFRWVDVTLDNGASKWWIADLTSYLTAGDHVILVSGILDYTGDPGTDWCDMGALTVSGGITLSENQIDPLSLLAEVESYGILLGDSIGIRFEFGYITEEYQIDFYIGQEKIPAVKQQDNTYIVSVSAAQMTEEITVYINGRALGSYSVRGYADVILAGDYADGIKTMVKEMLLYGGASQTYFDHNTDKLASAGITPAERQFTPPEIPDMSCSGEIEGLDVYGASLLFQSKTAVRFYFTGDVTDCVFTANGESYTPVEKDGKWYIEVAGIAPYALSETVSLTVTKGEQSVAVTYSPMNYIVRMYEKSDSATLKAALEAMYYYYLEAVQYHQILWDAVTYVEKDSTLFYRNENLTNLPDPFVLDNTARDGYYYLYGTWGAFSCYRSANLMDWQYCGEALQQWRENNMVWDATNEAYSYQVLARDMWAPEVVYDPDTQLYYMFFSASPDAEGQAVASGSSSLLMVATCDTPDGDFVPVNFKDANSCGEDNIHTYSESTYSDYFAPYLFLDPAQNKTFSTQINNEWRGAYNGGYAEDIDAHPYIAPNGTKYLFWVDADGPDRICGVEMENWLKPKWETAKALIYYNYYTVEDWENGANAGVSYEYKTTTNEGPFVVEHNGKYYMTYSANNWKNNSYLVAQAVADNVLGPYTKLSESEGGIVLSGVHQGSQESSGTGHHSLLAVGEQLFIIYHRHNDPAVGGASRNHAVDEIKWITINGLDVMYANGPTTNLQPRVEKHSQYVNIADEATVTSSGANPAYLYDGLLSHYKNTDFTDSSSTFGYEVSETTFSSDTTFTFTFDEARAVKGIMVYNSKMEDRIFRNISQIKLTCIENGKEVTRCIQDVAFNEAYYETNSSGTVTYVQPCSSAYAIFEELQVTCVEITVKIPEGQSFVGLSEIRILGK